jgi:hypothetical protein
MRPIIAVLLIASLALVAGCSKKTTPIAGSGTTGTVRLRMTDAPGPFDAVSLVVTQVAICRGETESDTSGGWEILSSTGGTYDLMQLRNGVFATLGQAMVPTGHYTQVRLKLGAGSTVTVGGETYPLTVPSGMQSGYKLNGEFDVPADQLVDLALDFDAAHSIHQTGNGRWMLNPVCRVMPFSTAGAIDGNVLPDTATATVYAIVGADTLASTVPGAGGAFVLTPLGAGTYDVAIHAPFWRDTTIAGVAVTAQQTTHLGGIQLTAAQ